MKNPIKHQFIAAKNITLDARYQRALDEKRVAGMTAAFNESRLGAIEIAERADGKSVAIDGQHRVATVKACDPERLMLCIVHRGLTESEEAQLFLDLNGQRTKVGKLDEHRAAVIAQHPVALDIEAELRKQGLRVSKSDSPKSIRAVGALYSVSNVGNLSVVLTLAKGWRLASDNSFAYEAQNLKALSYFLSEYPEANLTYLASKLEKESPAKMIARYKRDRSEAGIPSRLSYVDQMLNLYNAKNRKPLLRQHQAA